MASERRRGAGLSAKAVQALNTPGRYSDGVGGLILSVSAGRSGPRKNWLLRYSAPDGRRREMGLGRYPDVSLADARRAAEAVRRDVAAKIDPLERKAAAKEAAPAKAEAATFRDAAEAYVAAHEAGWRNAKHRAQWVSTLATYAFPMIGAMPLSAVDTEAVLRVLAPIWTAKPETASRVRGRMETVLDYATARGWRPAGLPNPARWRGHLALTLPKRSKVAAVRHHPAVPIADMPALWAALAERTGAGADCLAFAILTAARSGEARGARWRELDMDKAVWTVPGPRMKGGREHRVPLSAAALAILKRRAAAHGCDPDALAFASDLRSRGQLSDMTLGAVLRRLGRTETPHGTARSSFRDWAGEAGFPRELAEAALAHAVADKTEAAYARSDLLERRRPMMAAWARFLEGEAAVEVAEPRRRKQTA